MVLELQFENITNRGAEEGLELEQVERLVEREKRLAKLKPSIKEFSHSYIPGITTVFRFSSSNHSYSKNHYKGAFRKDNDDETIRAKVWKELKGEITIAIRFYEKQENRKARKILLITFKEVANQIERHKKKLKKNRHRDIFSDMEVLPLFSNKMHGINANSEGFDLIITVGDPLDKSTAEFATRLGIFRLTKLGFQIKSGSIAKEAIIRTLISELLEAIHRSRASIPVLCLGNFLKQPEPENQEIINNILKRDNLLD